MRSASELLLPLNFIVAEKLFGEMSSKRYHTADEAWAITLADTEEFFDEPEADESLMAAAESVSTEAVVSDDNGDSEEEISPESPELDTRVAAEDFLGLPNPTEDPVHAAAFHAAAETSFVAPDCGCQNV